MEELVDLIATGESSSNISDRIKDILYVKASQRIDDARPEVASMMFNGEQEEGEE